MLFNNELIYKGLYILKGNNDNIKNEFWNKKIVCSFFCGLVLEECVV